MGAGYSLAPFFLTYSLMNFTYSQKPTGIDLVSLSDMKQFLRVDHADEDITITALLAAAAQSIQDYTGLHFVNDIFVMQLDSFYNVEFPYLISSVTSVSYYNSAGSLTVLPTANYFYDTTRKPGRINFIDTPTIREDNFNNVVIGGTVLNAINASLIHAIKMLTAHFYENRRAVVVGASTSVMPLGIQAIINPYRIISLK